MKKVLSALLAMVLLLMILPAGAITAYAAVLEYDYYVDTAVLDGNVVEGAVIIAFIRR